jgi:hypothetical protein
MLKAKPRSKRLVYITKFFRRRFFRRKKIVFYSFKWKYGMLNNFKKMKKHIRKYCKSKVR